MASVIRSRASKSNSNGAQNGELRATPAEQAAEGMDPIEDLISQIMEHEPSPHTRPHAEATPAARASDPPARRKPDVISPNVPLRELVLAWYEARGYRGFPRFAGRLADRTRLAPSGRRGARLRVRRPKR